MSYGIMRHIEWDPDSFEDHMCNQPAEKSPYDDEYEIRETIEWLIKAVSRSLPDIHKSKTNYLVESRPAQK
jgi:hypothetical protein